MRERSRSHLCAYSERLVEALAIAPWGLAASSAVTSHGNAFRGSAVASSMPRSWPSVFAAIASVAALVGCDQATKVAAVSSLRDQAPVALVRGALDLSYVENHDIAFDSLSRASLRLPPVALGTFAIVMAFVVAFVWARRTMSWPAHAGFAMIVAGALGNGIDRFQRGHVIDFIHLHHWPVFNVADMLVLCGMGLLVLARRPASSRAE